MEESKEFYRAAPAAARPADRARVAEHDLLTRGDGWWEVGFGKYMAGPDAAPIQSIGMDENRLLEGGLWLAMDQHYEYPGGIFQGRAMYGYDPRLKRYVGMWVDSTNAHLNVSEGKFDEKNQTLTLIADGVDPTTGERTVVKQVKVFQDADTMVFTVYRAGEDGKEKKLLEVTAKRRKRGFVPVKGRPLVGEWLATPFSPASITGFHHDWPSSKPTVFHNLLRRNVGVWEGSVVAHTSEDDPPLLSKGIERNTLIGNGLWLISDIRNEYAGGAFEGRGMLGYDPDVGKYVGAWVDSTNPHRTIWEGTYDEDSRALTLIGEGVDPRTGKPVKERHVTVFRDDGTREISLYRMRDGRDMRELFVTTRRVQ